MAIPPKPRPGKSGTNFGAIGWLFAILGVLFIIAVACGGWHS